jgi:hypothetical protein
MFLEWLNILRKEFPSDDQISGPLMTSFWSMLAGDVPGIWAPKEMEGKPSTFTVVCLKRENPGSVETRHQDFWSPSFAHRNTTRGRRLMITTNGFMGLAPWYAEEGQELAILSNCSAPVLLHEYDDGTYRLIGSCFVQEWMEGEMLANYGPTPEEAWDNIELQGRLRIV